MRLISCDQLLISSDDLLSSGDELLISGDDLLISSGGLLISCDELCIMMYDILGMYDMTNAQLNSISMLFTENGCWYVTQTHCNLQAKFHIWI